MAQLILYNKFLEVSVLASLPTNYLHFKKSLALLMNQVIIYTVLPVLLKCSKTNFCDQ